MFASTLPKNTMTQIRQVALVLVDTLLALFPSFWNCSSARAAAACFATRILVFHLREEGGSRGKGGEKKRGKDRWDKSVQFFASYCQGFSQPLLSLIPRRKCGAFSIDLRKDIVDNYIKVRYFEKSFQWGELFWDTIRRLE